ncbi:hypothetical protein CHS0354_035211 [Potamilus streckersoni]|uniref:UvrD-like helicase C-terminal domain-containing protein n=1 Tax=Potamilus streckersoni TaxID=2493646 RepID=A0AAE0VNI1_9BIVA|nr:hypothetical protein CHS0354_035211 [Potamilus streckersoni]
MTDLIGNTEKRGLKGLKLVEVAGFEPTTPCSRSKYATTALHLAIRIKLLNSAEYFSRDDAKIYFGKKLARKLAPYITIPSDRTRIESFIFTLYLNTCNGHCTDYLTLYPDVFGAGGEFKPVIYDRGAFYFHKYFSCEHALAQLLLDKLSDSRTDQSNAYFRTINEKLSLLKPDLPEIRRQAVLNALTSKLTVIAGGPGTGKTSAVIDILHMVYTVTAHKLMCYICAPTGKAAARLRESLKISPQTASPLHSLILQFQHLNPVSEPPAPLFADYVIVDESSMLDVFLARSLLQAFTTGNPLSSVEAGSVFHDIYHALSEEHTRAKTVFTFDQNYRFSDNPGLTGLAQAVLSGDADSFAGYLKTGYGQKTAGLIKKISPENYRDYISHAVMLTPLKTGHYGSRSLNRLIELHIRQILQVPEHEEWYHGRKIILLKNHGEFHNGDVGVCLKEADGEFRIRFDMHTEGYSLYSIGEYEPAYALTIHKSQGSEYRHTEVILPEEASDMMTREMIYTAVTRAREKLTLYGNYDTIVKGLARHTSRQTRLKERLTGAV